MMSMILFVLISVLISYMKHALFPYQCCRDIKEPLTRIDVKESFKRIDVEKVTSPPNWWEYSSLMRATTFIDVEKS